MKPRLGPFNSEKSARKEPNDEQNQINDHFSQTCERDNMQRQAHATLLRASTRGHTCVYLAYMCNW